MAETFLGCKISLISKAKARYEGILALVDVEKHTLTLEKVRLFGTEDRQVAKPINPKDGIYASVMFRASDIEDLHVIDAAPSAAMEDPAVLSAVEAAPPQYQQRQPPPPPPLPTSAPPSRSAWGTSAPAPPQQQRVANTYAARAAAGGAPGGAPSYGASSYGAPSYGAPANAGANRGGHRNNFGPAPYSGGAPRGGHQQQQQGGRPQQQQQQQQQPYSGQQGGQGQPRGDRPQHHHPRAGGAGGAPKPSSGAKAGTGDALLELRTLGSTGAANAGAVTEEFDFLTALSKFDKAREKAIVLGSDGGANNAGDANTADGAPDASASGSSGALPVIAPAYNKAASFFDTLSSGGGGRTSMAEERRQNADTFGATGLAHEHGGPGGFRHHGQGGGYRGGRGGYGGGGSGGGYRGGRGGYQGTR